MWTMKRVSSPKVSPDGQWVIFSVTEPSYDPQQQVSDLWLVPTSGAQPPRRLTFTQGSEGGVTWTPDSRRVLFTAKREGDEHTQVYVLEMSGGEARRVTQSPHAVSSASFSPDGSMILFEALVDPNAPGSKPKHNASVYESFPIRYWDRWLDRKQVRLFVQPLNDAAAKPQDLLADSRLVAEKGFGGSLTSSGQTLEPVWTPDGKSIVFAATTSRHTAAFAQYPRHLFQVALSGDEPRPLTSGSDVSYSSPTFSPDGKVLYAQADAINNFVYNLTRLARLDWPSTGTAQPRVITAKWDKPVGSFSFNRSGSNIYVLAEDAGHVKLYSIPAAEGDVIELTPLDRGSYSALDSATGSALSEALVAIWESSINPPEVVRIDPQTRRYSFLSSLNTDAAARIDWQPPRHFWFTNPEGMKIHSMLVLPPAFDAKKKYPLLVLMHGGPHSMWIDQFVIRWNYHLLARPGYVVLLTNYRGSTGFGEKFAQSIQGDPLRGPANDINQAADEAIRQFTFIDGSRQAAAGASYGGHLANWMQATTKRYKCLVSHAGLINLESQWGTSDTIYHREMGTGGPVWEQGTVWREQNPIRYAKEFSTPMLVTVGERDYRVPLNQSIENWSVLQRLQVPSKLIVFHDENHWILKGENSRFFYSELHDWFARWLNPASATNATE
jgi:dipeptidyl aminopeptidase/acylaminoacyl peptidase